MEKYYNLKEVSKILGVNRITLYNWEKAGRLHMVRLSKRATRVSESELKRLLGAQEINKDER